RAVPEEAQTYLVGATNFGTQADAGSERDAAADNGRLADDSNAVVRQVHGAAAALADARCFAHQLGHQRLQISAFANGVTVRAVRARHGIVIAKRHAGADDGGFFANARMVGARDLSRSEQSNPLLLKLPDPNHAPVGFPFL